MPKPSNDLQQPEFKWLDLEDFRYLCFDLARELLTNLEPIPDFSTHDSNLLASSLASPRQKFDNQFLYPTLIKQASILFYSIIKNHPFKNGNKRIALMSLLAHLSINNKWLNTTDEELYQLACEVAESLPSQKDEMLNKIENLIEKSLTD